MRHHEGAERTGLSRQRGGAGQRQADGAQQHGAQAGIAPQQEVVRADQPLRVLVRGHALLLTLLLLLLLRRPGRRQLLAQVPDGQNHDARALGLASSFAVEGAQQGQHLLQQLHHAAHGAIRVDRGAVHYGEKGEEEVDEG